jgi:hypothetical protein
MRVYISGPMTGYPDFNRTAFKNAAADLRRLDHEPVDPGDAEVPEQTWADYLRADLRMLLDCDAVAVLPGWEASRGAALEVHVAHQLGMTVLPITAWRGVPA